MRAGALHTARMGTSAKPPSCALTQSVPAGVNRAFCVSLGLTRGETLALQGPSVATFREPEACCQLFHRCQRAVQALPSRARRACSEQEERLLRNVGAALAQAVQELSASFRCAQSAYLRRECLHPTRGDGDGCLSVPTPPGHSLSVESFTFHCWVLSPSLPPPM